MSLLWITNQMQAKYEVADLNPETTRGNCNFHFHLYLALGKVPFCLAAVFAYVTSYTTSLFRNNFSYQAGHLLLERKTRPQHRELHALLFRNNVWVL